MYEMFLDEKGQKISKSKGNGITMDDWLPYGSPESLALFMFQKPRTAKRLYFDVDPQGGGRIYRPRGLSARRKRRSERWRIRSGTSMAAIRRTRGNPVSFALLLNLAGVERP